MDLVCLSFFGSTEPEQNAPQDDTQGIDNNMIYDDNMYYL